MKSMLGAFVAIAVIAVGAWWGLSEYGGWDAEDRGSAQESVRLD